MRKRRASVGAFGVTLLLLLGACSPAGSDESTTTSPPVPTTETPSTPSTTAAAATTTTTVETTTSTAAVTTTTKLDSNAFAEGSGCTPGTDVLPDGVWFGEVADFSESSISFDLACWFTGDAAVIASAEDGEESPPPNDYYVRNLNDVLRDLEVDPATAVTWYPTGDPTSETEGTFEEWGDLVSVRGFFFGIWVTIEDGSVTSIVEQWVP